MEIIKTLDVGDEANIEEIITALENAGIDRQRAETSISKL